MRLTERNHCHEIFIEIKREKAHHDIGGVTEVEMAGIFNRPLN